MSAYLLAVQFMQVRFDFPIFFDAGSQAWGHISGRLDVSPVPAKGDQFDIFLGSTHPPAARCATSLTVTSVISATRDSGRDVPTLILEDVFVDIEEDAEDLAAILEHDFGFEVTKY